MKKANTLKQAKKSISKGKTRTQAKAGASGPKLVQHSITSPSSATLFPVVGVGASAGGLESFQKLLKSVPVASGMAFVLVQHLDPDHESALTEILARASSIPVQEATNDLPIQPNHVYIIPPNCEMTIEGRALRLRTREQTVGAHHTIDLFLKSLAKDQKERAIGVILSGTATDGTLGLEAIKSEGGITLAQDGSAKYDAMPRSAISAGCVDYVLPPEKIALELERIAKHPYVKGERATRLTSWTAKSKAAEATRATGTTRGLGAIADEGLKAILLLLRQRHGVDFSFYKPATIHRRITRRMVLRKVETMKAYAESLRGDETELEALYSDLLINVTSFFRNPEAFDALKREVFPKLVQDRDAESLRIWVLGCSTGQEAYSIAMSYLEFSDKLPHAPRLQIFATDLNEALLVKARQGLYAKGLVQELSPERLRRFFVEEEGGYRVVKNLRDMCVFARQNFLSDPPFSRMDLISCRNLLIYIEPALQNKILPTFHYALKPHGFLLLGASESIGPFTALFKPLDKKLRLFARKTSGLPRASVPRTAAPTVKRENPPAGGKPEHQAVTAAVDPQREADRITIHRYAPSGVLVNADLQILQFRGTTGAYMEPAAGKASLDLLKMVQPSLMLPLRDAINKAKKTARTVRTENVRLSAKAPTRRVNLEVIPLKNLSCYLVFFEEALKPDDGTPQAATPSRKEARKDKDTDALVLLQRNKELERELAEIRDYLQTIQEQNEAANEELQAANEEATSANEELQSMNEELETSKEELESTNEELATVNDEMANRNQDLSELNSDLNNLHASMQTPVLVLGRDLSIRRFTPQAQRVFNLLASDIGRPLSGIKHNLLYPELEAFIAEVIHSLNPSEREVQDRQGAWYLLRVRPYLTMDNKIDGAVLMLMDIQALKQTERRITEAGDFARAVIEAVPPLLILESDLRVRNANQSFYNTFNVTAEQTEGRLIYELGNGQWNIPLLRQLFEEIVPRSKAFHQYEVTHDFEDIGRRTMLMSGCRVDHLHAIVLSIEDITLRKQAEEALSDHRKELERLVAERTAKLHETIAELLHFSYTITHDMRAPLRAMRGYGNMLLTEESALSENGQMFVNRISDAAARMDKLITDALDYAKLSQHAFEIHSVDAAALLRGMLASYPDYQPSKAQISIAENIPPILANEAGLTQCFSNLLDNAIKFVQPDKTPEIRIWAEERELMKEDKEQKSTSKAPQTVVRLWLEDNGIGIALDQQNKVFGMFQQVNQDIEGTGIGLALVRKAAQRMNGSVGVESVPGKGSRFWMEFNKA